MAGSSSIEWTEMTWNPVTGCTKVSQGCKNCYAERMAKRLQAMGVHQYRDGFRPTLAPQVLNEPYRWRRAKLVFVNSMSDLFHEDVPVSYIQRVFEVMNNTPHTYQILTKRPERAAQLSEGLRWTANIWLGVSIENERVVSRLGPLRRSGAKHRFLSLEPLLGPLDRLDLRKVDWVIVGGESGPRARPMRKEWVEAIRNRCRDFNVPFFFKQWGKASWNDDPNDPTRQKSHPHYAKGGCQLNGTVYRSLPVLPATA